MKTFKSLPDLDQVRGTPLYALVHDLVAPLVDEYSDYHPDDDGYLVLIEPEDVAHTLSDLGLPWHLAEIPFEAVTLTEDHFHAVYLPNNQFALGFLIPDANWLPGDVRRHLLRHLDT